MRFPAPAALRATRRPHPAWLFFAAALLALGLTLHGPIAQWAGYHAFADARSWLGLPNALNVLSNLPFALIGAWGLWVHARAPRTASAQTHRNAWWCFSAALTCTAFGSALYHWAPGNALLVGDRLPIAWACAALLCAFLSERVDERWAGVPALAAAFAASSAAVAWWWFSEPHGRGDLRPYLYVQFLPMLIVPFAIWLRLPILGAHALRNGTWWAGLALYGGAKLMEFADQTVFEALGFTSGHTLKHLLAAAAALVLLRAALRPKALPERRAAPSQAAPLGGRSAATGGPNLPERRAAPSQAAPRAM